MKKVLLSLILICPVIVLCQGISLPDQFENVPIIAGLNDPSSIAFSPDGRMFISERISGQLRVAKYDPLSMSWEVLPTPFFTFDVPSTQHRSSGLRGIAFDPNFESNGFVYAFYMKNNPRHNRVVRIQSDANEPDVALAGETLLIELPFNSSTSSGSHNGGDLVFGSQGMLYVTTGDGWNGGDDVQDLGTFTGKLLRIQSDGSIPSDNPFYNLTTGNYRSIYALGLRNPYTMSCASETGNIYINDAVLSQKATVYQIKNDSSSSGVNFGHDGYNGIGTETAQWVNVSVGGAKLITGGAWYPLDGYWPESYRGNYFAAMWGSNNGNAGHIVRVNSETDLSKSVFATGVLVPPRHKPVMTEIGPDDNLYYLLTDYETGDGQVHMIRFTGQSVAAAPSFHPAPNQYDDPVFVHIESSSDSSVIYYTLDGSDPDTNSTVFLDSIFIDASLNLKAIVFADSILPSSISNGAYIIGPIPNLKPVADAGPDLIVEVNKVATLNGSGSYDPDGSALEISESWEQVDGPQTVLLDDDETVANFLPTLTGTYTFRIKVQDVDGAIDSADVHITAVDLITDVLDGLIARWSCEDGIGTQLEDTSPNANRGYSLAESWSNDTPDSSLFSMRFDADNERVDIGNLDISGQSLTICFWALASSFGTHDARFISKANGQNDVNHLWMVSTLNGDQLRFRLNTDVGGTKTLISDENTFSLNEWTHIAVTYDGSFMRIYKNGSVIDSTEKSGNISTDPFMDAAIGNQPANIPGGDRPFDGLLDEIRIYGNALSPIDISTVMQAEVEKCGLMVSNSKDLGNGSFRRAIACATTGDSISFSSQINDTISILTNPIDMNNTLTIYGEQAPVISNNLNEPGLDIGSGVHATLTELKLHSTFGPLIFNAGLIQMENVELMIPEGVLLPPFQNVGEAKIFGQFSILK